jgi:GNAT superfamily N-acetyltransferase
MITIRRAEINDIQIVIDMRIAFLKEESGIPNSETVDTQYIRKYVEEKLPTGEYLVWLAEDGERVVGTGGLVFFHRPPGFTADTDVNAMIFNMYTIPEYRSQGIATGILKDIAEYVSASKTHKIILYATDIGRPVYERFGFKSADNYMTISL